MNELLRVLKILRRDKDLFKNIETISVEWKTKKGIEGRAFPDLIIKFKKD